MYLFVPKMLRGYTSRTVEIQSCGSCVQCEYRVTYVSSSSIKLDVGRMLKADSEGADSGLMSLHIEVM